MKQARRNDAPEDEDDDQKPPPNPAKKQEEAQKDDATPAPTDKPAEKPGDKPADKPGDKPAPAPKLRVEKSDVTEILASLKGVTTQLSALATKVDGLATEQVAQKKTLDEVVQKADTLSTTLKTTVTAPPSSREDRPADGMRMRVQKDDDPRTGNFDTAFMRKRR